MKGLQAIIGHHKGQQIACLMKNGQLHDAFYAPQTGLPVGSIVRAKAERSIKGLGGVLLRGPEGPLFLRRAQNISAGQMLTVQISGHAERHKAPPATMRLLFKSRYCIVTPNAPGLNISRKIKDADQRDQLHIFAKSLLDDPHIGLILRSSAALAQPSDIEADIIAMLDLARTVSADHSDDIQLLLEGDSPHDIAWREWFDADANVITDDAVLNTSGALDQLAQMLDPYVPLAQGHIYIEPTRAFTAVDVNTGADMSPAAALKVNMAAVKELPRQLRLRGLGGQIVIDFAPLGKRDRQQIEIALRAAFRACPVGAEFIGWTALSHAELTRKRERLPLSEAFGIADFE